jgi:hypothetical protein
LYVGANGQGGPEENLSCHTGRAGSLGLTLTYS